MAEANSFLEALLRLKEQLKVGTDKEVAALLGMSSPAFNQRKARNAFPEDRLFALAAKRPDLGIDPQYVLTGYRSPGDMGRLASELARLAGELVMPTPEAQETLGQLAGRAIKQTTVESRRSSAYAELRLLCNAMDDERYQLVHKLAECLARDSVHLGKAPDR